MSNNLTIKMALSRKMIFTDTRGVSVIIGAMLLIIIAVTAATAIAYMVTNLQRDIAEKESLTTAIELEELDITKISLYQEATIDDFEGVYEIVMGKAETEIGYRILNKTPKWDSSSGITKLELVEDTPLSYGKYLLHVSGNGWISKTFEPFEYESNENLTLSFWIRVESGSDNVEIMLYNDGSETDIKGITVNSSWEEKEFSTSKKFDEVKFSGIRGNVYLDNLKYTNPGYWGEIELTIRNLNIDKSTLKEVAIKKHFAHNYSVFTRKGKEVFTPTYPYDIPAHSTAPVRMDFLTDFGSPVHIETTESIETLLITSLGNNFADAFAPPVPSANVEVVTEDLGIAYRDVLILDASESYDPDGFITEYGWEIFVYNKPDDTYELLYNHTGRKLRQELNQTGPFKIDLVVTDDSGMVAKLSEQSGKISIAENQNFNPPVSLYAIYNEHDKVIKAWVNDTEGSPVEGIVVNFVCIHNDNTSIPVTLSQGSATIKGGHAAVEQKQGSGGGTIRVKSGNLPYVDVRVDEY